MTCDIILYRWMYRHGLVLGLVITKFILAVVEKATACIIKCSVMSSVALSMDPLVERSVGCYDVGSYSSHAFL